MGLMQKLLTLLAAGQEITPAHAGELVGRARRITQGALSRLATRGLAQSLAGVYAVTPDGIAFAESGGEIKPGPRGPRGTPRVVEDTMRAKAWRAIRIKGKFGLDDLARSVLDGSEPGKDPINNLSRYVSALAATGYLAEMARRTPGHAVTSPGKKRWLLVRDTGPKAPVRRENGDVWDRNEGRIYPRGGQP
jgi:hypothetical protein